MNRHFLSGTPVTGVSPSRCEPLTRIAFLPFVPFSGLWRCSWCVFKYLFCVLERVREAEDAFVAGSYPKWLQQLGLDQAEARGLPFVPVSPRVAEPCHFCYWPRCISGDLYQKESRPGLEQVLFWGARVAGSSFTGCATTAATWISVLNLCWILINF